jgi:DNA polymerase/3'-5' exonuclease PolX
MVNNYQKKILIEGIEQLALEFMQYHVEVDRHIFEYSPAIIDYHVNLLKENINENYQCNHIIYNYDTLLTENVREDLMNASSKKHIALVREVSSYVFGRVKNKYVFKPRHIKLNEGFLSVDWKKFNLEEHIRFLKESLEHEVIANLDWRLMNGWWDGSPHVIKESKLNKNKSQGLLTEGQALGCEKKPYEYAKNVFENAKNEVYDVLTEGGFYVDDIYSAGSLRRQKDVIGDIDLIINITGHKDFGKVNRHPLDEKRFLEQYQWLFGQTLKKSINSEVVKNYKNISQFIKEDMQCDAFFCTPTAVPTRICYWTGSAAHNVKMLYEGYKRNIVFSYDYIFDKNRNKFLVPKNERQIFSVLGVDYVEPKDRK